MPVRVAKRKNKYRVCDPDGTITKRGNVAVDGGGHGTKQAAMRQAQAININMHKRKK